MLNQDVKDALLSLVGDQPILVREVREKLVQQGFKDIDVRRAINKLWSEGWLNVRVEQTLQMSIPNRKQELGK